MYHQEQPSLHDATVILSNSFLPDICPAVLSTPIRCKREDWPIRHCLRGNTPFPPVSCWISLATLRLARWHPRALWSSSWLTDYLGTLLLLRVGLSWASCFTAITWSCPLDRACFTIHLLISTHAFGSCLTCASARAVSPRECLADAHRDSMANKLLFAFPLKFNFASHIYVIYFFFFLVKFLLFWRGFYLIHCLSRL